MILSVIVMKDIRLRKLLCGTPTIVVKDGKLLPREMNRVRMSIDELTEELRLQGVTDFQTVKYAILETSGQVSVLLYQNEQPATAAQLRDLVDGTALVYSVLRLGILPLIAWGVSLAVGMEPVATGVAVLMTGMPAGATAAIFAARYNSDAPFAARCVVLSTLFSMLTIPLWCWVVG